MNNVNDLNAKKLEDLTNSAPTQQPISLSALKDDESSVNINATNGLSGVVEEEVTSRPTININPRRKVHRNRSAENGSSSDLGGFKQVNPDDYIEKKPAVKPISPKDKAMNLLSDAVTRKQNEYKEFVANAIESDKINRERVEAGIETVGEEIQYMPDDLHVPMDESEKVKAPTEDNDFEETESNNANRRVEAAIAQADDSTYSSDEDDFEYEDADDLSNFEADTSSTVVSVANPMFAQDIIEEDTNDELVTTTQENEDRYDDSSLEGKSFFDKEEERIINDANNAYEELMNEMNANAPIATTDEVVAVTEPAVVEKATVAVAPVDNVETPEDKLNEYDGGIFSKPINVTASALDNPISDTTTNDFDIDEEDLEGVTAPVDDVLSDEEVMKISDASEKHLKSEILQKIIQAGKTMDTTQFIVSNKVINIKDALKTVPAGNRDRTAIWPLTYAGRPYKASALKGPEIAMLADADNSESNGGVGLTIDQARIMFEHDANPYRPATIEAWAKTIPYSDIENIFAAMYVASLKGANYIPMACPKNSCQYAYLSEDIDIDKMIKFDNDEAKKRFEDIKKMEITAENTGSYESVVNVINDNFAIGIKVPSIFTILYEYDALNSDFIQKYTAMVSIIQYIDYIYYIDSETKQFQPIGWKTYPGDHGKSFKSKIATYSKILKELDDTDFTVMIALINSMINKVVESRGIRYEIPSEKCPKCGATINAREINARGLVFMRQRLVELATTPSAR